MVQAGPIEKAPKITLHFTDTPDPQALFAALRATSEDDDRRPVTRQAKYLLRVGLGLLPPDLYTLKRIELAVHANMPKAQLPVEPQQAARRVALRLIRGGVIGDQR